MRNPFRSQSFSGAVLLVASLISGAAMIGCGGGSKTPTSPSTPGSSTANSADGTASISLPANDGLTSAQITMTPSTNFPASTGLVANTAYDVGPSGTTFATPVTLTIKYSPSALPAGAVASQLAIYTVTNGAWTAVAGSTVNTSANTVTASLSHFSTYAILASNSFAGTFIGRYSGTVSGNFQMVVFPSGALQVTGVDASSGAFSGTGTLSLTGAANLVAQGSGTVTSGGTFTFTGTFQNAGPSETASGTYTTQLPGSPNGSGVWSIP